MSSLALAAPSQATITIGSNLRAVPSADEGLCALAAGQTSRSCVLSQLTVVEQHLVPAGLEPAAGTVVNWRVRSAAASPATRAVGLRLVVLDSGLSSPFYSLPPTAGMHDFPAHLEIEPGERVALETKVEGTGAGPAYAPIAHFEAAVGSIGEWLPPFLGLREDHPDSAREGTELLLSAEIETDRQPPRTKLSYPPRQDFLRTHSAVVYLRSNENAGALAVAQLEWPRGNGPRAGSVIYQVQDARRKLEAGTKTPLRLQIPQQTREAAERAVAHGKRVIVKAFVTATDAAGNRSGTTVAAIRPR